MTPQSMTSSPSFKWNEPAVKRLRSLTVAGRSAAQIARELGVTRNAIMGKINRTPGLRLVGLNDVEVARRIEFRVETPWTKAPPESPPLNALVVILHPPVTMMDLEPHQCRWIVSDEGEALFCARPTPKTYCRDHRARALDRTAQSRTAPKSR